MNQPCSAPIGDDLVSVREVRRREPAAQRHRPRFDQAAPLARSARQHLAVIFHRDLNVGRLRAFQQHGRVRDTLAEGADEAQRVLERFAKAGVDYVDVTDTLERQGVRAFEKSFASLLDGLRDAAAEARSKPEVVG